MGDAPGTESFHWSTCAQRLRAQAARADFSLERRGRFFEASRVRITPPLVFPIPRAMLIEAGGPESAPEIAGRRARASGSDLVRYIDSLPEAPGLQCLILMQAGAASIGIFRAGEPLATKSLKRYVVRGKGRAQPAFLSTKGKSRYGSRLRLQNARILIAETNAKLHSFWDEFGHPEHLFVGAPVRLWPELFRSSRQPPFSQDVPILRVPLDLPVPTTQVLLRTYRSLCHGRLEHSE